MFIGTLRILHLNTFENIGGASIATQRLHRALCSEGILSTMFNFSSYNTTPNLNILPARQRAKVYFNLLLEKWGHIFYKKKNRLPFTLFNGLDVKLSQKALKAFDIIHIHWVQSGFLNISSMATLAQSHHVVYTFHDSFPFTGGCHVKMGCTRFRDDCHNCPQVSSTMPRRNQKNKQVFWKEANVKIICPSHWMRDEALSTGVIQESSTCHIPNIIDTRLFCPRDKNEIRKKYGLDIKKKIVLLGHMPSKNDYHKGGHFFNRLNKECEKTGCLLLSITTDPKNSNMAVPPAKDEKTMAEYFALSDVYVHSSLDDNLPNTILESMSCGTPVIAFDVGGIPEIIDHKVNGILLEKGNLQHFSETLLNILDTNNYMQYSKNARTKVLEKYNPDTITQKHIKLYQEVLEKK